MKKYTTIKNLKHITGTILPSWGDAVGRGVVLPSWGDAVGRGVGFSPLRGGSRGVMVALFTLLTLISFSQGTLKENGRTISSIPVYDLSGGDTEWVLNINNLYSYKWSVFFNFSSIAGTKDGTIAVYVSCDDGTSWVAYPDMTTATISANGSYSFDDSYTVYDKLKFAFTANSISGGSVTINQRLFSNPKK